MTARGDVVLRVQRNANYKTISLVAIHDSRLSWKAKGLHTYLVSRPDGWKFNRLDLEHRSTDQRASVGTGLAELQDAGYLTMERERGAGGLFSGWTWTVRETPDPPKVDFP